MERKPSVLIVDRSEETREVLQTALNRKGVQTFTAGRANEGVELGRLHNPDLVVVDLDTQDVNLDQSTPFYWGGRDQNETPVIFLGTLRRNQSLLRGSEIMSKPYHFGPLIRRIEELLSVNGE